MKMPWRIIETYQDVGGNFGRAAWQWPLPCRMDPSTRSRCFAELAGVPVAVELVDCWEPTIGWVPEDAGFPVVRMRMRDPSWAVAGELLILDYGVHLRAEADAWVRSQMIGWSVGHA